MEAKKWMMESSGIDGSTLEDCMFMYKDRDAVNHLMRYARLHVFILFEVEVEVLSFFSSPLVSSTN